MRAAMICLTMAGCVQTSEPSFVSNAEMQRMAVVFDRRIGNADHPEFVMGIACSSYVGACDPHPFTLKDKWEYRSEYPSSAKLGLMALAKDEGMPLFCYPSENRFKFPIVQSAGNYGSANYFDKPKFREDAALRNCRDVVLPAMMKHGKVLYVAGLHGDNHARHPDSSGCVGVEQACVWSPWNGSDGTSGAAARVFGSLASVLAVHPHLSGFDLVQLAKACADKIPGLPGLGTINVECMLTGAGSRE